ncbi:MAG: PIN domain-containing protein [Candidatus Dormibacteria bacterium]
MRSVLDTSVLLGPPPRPIDGDLAISAASLAELHYGVLVAGSDAIRAERLRRLGVIERTFAALPIDDLVARHYGRLASATAATGRQPRAGVMDLLIAATAAAHGARLCTRNPGDLAGLGHLIEIIALAGADGV